MADKKRTPIKYTSRDFESIKQDLIDYARRYYPEVYRDFNEASFGSLMIDTVAYVGDILSFYLDYQVNESFLDSAAEYDNVRRLARQLGYKPAGAPSSTGVVSFYIVVPANSVGLGPDSTYLPILKRGSTLSSLGGAIFTLNSDVDFSNSNVEVIVAQTDPTSGVPTSYALKTEGTVVSGRIVQENFTIGAYERFRKLALSLPRVTEVISVTDSEGREYYEVDYLSQDVVYRDVINRQSDSEFVPSILRPYSVPRRYVVESTGDISFLQFGYGTGDESSEATPMDPSNVVLQQHAKEYITDRTFDPSRLVSSDKFGVAPSNTVLTITYRTNVLDEVNVSAGSLVNISNPQFSFQNITQLNSSTVLEVQQSLEVYNTDPILGDTTEPSAEEIRRRAIDFFAAQNRAVTKEDYESLAYSMDKKFGSVKRCSVIQDPTSFKRNLNMYVLSEGAGGKLSLPTSTIKNNLKTWLNMKKMINDTIDIIDGKIVNIGIEFEIIHDLNYNKFDVLNRCVNELRKRFADPGLIGEPFYITDVYNYLNDVIGVIDTTKVNITNLQGGQYSDTFLDIDSMLSADGRYVKCPLNAAFEIKFPSLDIKGSVK